MNKGKKNEKTNVSEEELAQIKEKLYSDRHIRRKKVYMMNITPNEKTNIIELLATIVLLVNTFILIIFQNTITYEKVTLFEITPKSSYLTIMQHNPIFGIIYMTCGVILLICAIDRLIKYTKSKSRIL